MEQYRFDPYTGPAASPGATCQQPHMAQRRPSDPADTSASASCPAGTARRDFSPRSLF